MELIIFGAISELGRRARHHLSGGGSIDYDVQTGLVFEPDSDADEDTNLNDRVTNHVNKGILYGVFFCVCCLAYPLLFVPDVIMSIFSDRYGVPDTNPSDAGYRTLPG